MMCPLCHAPEHPHGFNVPTIMVALLDKIVVHPAIRAAAGDDAEPTITAANPCDPCFGTLHSLASKRHRIATRNALTVSITPWALLNGWTPKGWSWVHMTTGEVATDAALRDLALGSPEYRSP